MLIERPLGNLGNQDLDALAARGEVDLLDLGWNECALRAWRKTTRGGQMVKALLGRGVTLGHADLIGEQTPEHPAVAINIMPCDVLVTAPLSATDAAIAAFELGNLHAPTQIQQSIDGSIVLITLPDGPNEAVLRGMSIPYTPEHQRFNPRRLAVLPQFSDDFRVIYPRT